MQRFFVSFFLLLVCIGAAFPQDIPNLKTKAESGDATAELQLAKAYETGKGVKADRFAAADWYLKAANAGNAEAQNTTGVLFRTGDGGRKDPEEAVRWFRMAAKQGYADAMFNLGTAYYNGDGVGINDRVALAWFIVSQAFGSAPATDAVQRGTTDLSTLTQREGIHIASRMLIAGLENPSKPEAAVPWLKKLSDAGDLYAKLDLARMSLEGIGVPKDPESARQYCEQGAKAKFASAMACLAVMYRKGLGVPPNPQTAANWYRKAAECGEANSLYVLGQMYGSGEGVKSDPIEQYWMLELAGTVLPQARQEADALKPQLDAKSLNKAEQRSSDFKKRAIASGCVNDTLRLRLRH